ncbi:MAG: MerR family transcriptional regulator [Phenylobacterium sp.]
MGRLGLGEACRLFGFTPRALRLYDERGLVRAERDHLNRRYYDDAGRERLAWIAQLRRARVSLPDIRSVLEAEEAHGGGWDLALEKLQARRRALHDELARVDTEIARLGRPPRQTRVPRLSVG